MPSRRFPKPWTVEPMPSGYRVIDANGMVLSHVYGQPVGAIAVSDTRLTNGSPDLQADLQPSRTGRVGEESEQAQES
jgi:hypothetical protein